MTQSDLSAYSVGDGLISNIGAALSAQLCTTLSRQINVATLSHTHGVLSGRCYSPVRPVHQTFFSMGNGGAHVKKCY